ncbi:hypothetical protein BU17DRAFT_68979 [Hysterangium stoloniferum]|nr:hypothetical protein BU17DRAFT_68979 [Hysterangium stoloniferum]
MPDSKAPLDIRVPSCAAILATPALSPVLFVKRFDGNCEIIINLKGIKRVSEATHLLRRSNKMIISKASTASLLGHRNPSQDCPSSGQSPIHQDKLRAASRFGAAPALIPNGFTKTNGSVLSGGGVIELVHLTKNFHAMSADCAPSEMCAWRGGGLHLWSGFRLDVRTVSAEKFVPWQGATKGKTNELLTLCANIHKIIRHFGM